MRLSITIVGLLMLLAPVQVSGWDDWHFTCEQPAGPGARIGAAMAYDSHRDCLYLFGRLMECSGVFTSADIRKWTPGGWSLAGVSDAPSMALRGRGSFAFDAARNVSVWYGGESASALYDETWTWDGAVWTQQNSVSYPSIGASGYPMVYDTDRQVCVMARESDTWEWDGTNWQLLSTTVSPGAGTGSAMAYDSDRHRVVLFGTSGLRTMEFDGVDWEDRMPATTFTEHQHAAMFYDSNIQRTILFGGYVGLHEVSDDTYSWDGTDWTLLAPAQSPPAGAEYAAAFHNGLNMGVITSGTYKSMQKYLHISSTWLWDGSTWAEWQPAERPSHRFRSATAWDSNRRVMVLYGGITHYDEFHNFVYSTETWEYNGTEWTLQSPVESPPALYGSMAYHAPSNQTFFVTGTNPVQTWLWNGVNWSQASTSGIYPSADPMIACNTINHTLILVIGSDTYSWSGSDWTLFPSGGLPYSSYPTDLAFDRTRNQFILLRANVDDLTTWVFDGTSWTDTNQRMSLYRAKLAWDPGTGNVIAIGGGDQNGYPMNEFWEYDGSGWTIKDIVSFGGPGRFEFPAVCTHETGIYCFGGKTTLIDFLNELWNIQSQEYVPATHPAGILIMIVVTSVLIICRRRFRR